MAGTMSKADLVTDLKASIHDATSLFDEHGDADYERHLDVAARGLARFRPRTLLGTIIIEADVFEYAAPTDMVGTKSPLWGLNERKLNQWERGYPGKLPRMSLVGDEMHLSPAPTANQITLLGSTYKFYYFAAHQIGDTAEATTVRASDRGLLLLRAQAEAMREMTIHQVNKPVKVIQGVGSQPREGTPAALYQTFMAEFERVGACG